MASSATAAFGALLKLGSTTVAEITKITLPAFTLETQETTTHESSGGWDEYVGTIKRVGEWSCEGNWLPNNATHDDAVNGLLGELTRGRLGAWSVVVPSSPTLTLSLPSYVVTFDPGDLTTDGKLAFTATFKGSGQPTLT